MSSSRIRTSRALALSLTLGSICLAQPLWAQSADGALSTSESGAAYPIHLQGRLAHVGDKPGQAILISDDGSEYLLNLRGADIAMPGEAGGGRLADLTSGMEVRIDGQKSENGGVHALIVRVIQLPGSEARPEPTAPPIDSPPFEPSPIEPQAPVFVNGTVQSVHLGRNMVRVMVNGELHNVIMNDQTLITGDDNAGGTIEDGNSVPFAPGDQLRIDGATQADGTILANHIEVSPSQGRPNTLVGFVVSVSNPWFGRDFAIREPDGDRINIHVPEDIPITKGGIPLSVHRIQKGNPVRIVGFPDGGGFAAMRITVLPVRIPQEPHGYF